VLAMVVTAFDFELWCCDIDSSSAAVFWFFVAGETFHPVHHIGAVLWRKARRSDSNILMLRPLAL
jgi:hypothetical protein